MAIFPSGYEQTTPILDGDQYAVQDSALNKLGWVYASMLQAYALSKQIGGLVLPQFTWSSITDITIGAGAWHHDGTKNQWVGQSALLTFVFGPGGSNAGSSAIGSDEWQYLYIDDSAVVTAATSVLTETEYIASTTVPTFNEAKGGFYNPSVSNDRAVYMVYIDGAGEVEGFYQIETDIFSLLATVEELTVAPSNVWTTYTCDSCPTIVDNFIASVDTIWISNSALAASRYRSKTLGGNGHTMAVVNSTGVYNDVGQILIPLDSSQQYELSFTAAVTNTITIKYDGFRLPEGMR